MYRLATLMQSLDDSKLLPLHLKKGVLYLIEIGIYFVTYFKRIV